jgi:hypothetical protein
LLAYEGSRVLVRDWINPGFPDDSRDICDQILQSLVFSFGLTFQTFKLKISPSFSSPRNEQTWNKEGWQEKRNSEDRYLPLAERQQHPWGDGGYHCYTLEVC